MFLPLLRFHFPDKVTDEDMPVTSPVKFELSFDLVVPYVIVGYTTAGSILSVATDIASLCTAGVCLVLAGNGALHFIGCLSTLLNRHVD